jgi:hypothetical protein
MAIYVLEAHRCGETSTGFWQRLLRFDRCNDRLRLQHVDRQQRDASLLHVANCVSNAGHTVVTRPASVSRASAGLWILSKRRLDVPEGGVARGHHVNNGRPACCNGPPDSVRQVGGALHRARGQTR